MSSAQADTNPGPPKVFALAIRPDGELVVGTVGRGLRVSRNGWRDWAAPADATFGVNALVVEPDGRLLAGTVARGVMTSSDGGEHWTAVGTALAGVTVNAVLPHAGGLLAGTAGKGVAWLEPGGNEWQWLDDAPRTVYRLLVVDRSVLAATLDHGVCSLAVPGHAHEPMGRSSGQSVHALLPLSTDLLAGTSGAGLQRSLDGGRSWRPVAPGVVDAVVHCLAGSGSTVLAGTANGVAASTDGGISWADASDGLASRRIFSVAVTPTGRLLAGGYDGVWTSPGVGARWRSVPTGLTAPEIYAVVVEPSGATLAGGPGRLWRSADGGATWSSSERGLTGRVVHGMTPSVAGARRYLGTDDGVLGETSDGGWAPAGLEGHCVLAVAAAAGRLFAATLGTGLWTSVDDGRAWTQSVDFTCPTATDVRVTSAGVLATGLDARTGSKTGGVFRYHDDDDSWRRLDAPPLAAYRVAEGPDGTLWVGAQRSTILRSNDGGASWQAFATTGLVDCKLYALTVAADGRVYIGTDGGVLMSSDAGRSWHPCPEISEGATPYSLAVVPGGDVVCGTSQGVRVHAAPRLVEA